MVKPTSRADFDYFEEHVRCTWFVEAKGYLLVVIGLKTLADCGTVIVS